MISKRVVINFSFDYKSITIYSFDIYFLYTWMMRDEKRVEEFLKERG